MFISSSDVNEFIVNHACRWVWKLMIHIFDNSPFIVTHTIFFAWLKKFFIHASKNIYFPTFAIVSQSEIHSLLFHVLFVCDSLVISIEWQSLTQDAFYESTNDEHLFVIYCNCTAKRRDGSFNLHTSFYLSCYIIEEHVIRIFFEPVNIL